MLSFLVEKIDITNPINYQLILNLIKSWDDNQHLVGIDVSDIKGFFSDESHLDIQHFTLESETHSVEQVLAEALPNTKRLFIHIEIGMNTSSTDEGPWLSLTQISDILSYWLKENLDGDLLFSVVLNRSKKCLNFWVITNERKCV